MTPDPTLQLALDHHRHGRLAQAESLYRQLLAQNPRHADALHLLGVLALQIGRPNDALQCISQAIALQNNVATYHNNLGEVFRTLGRTDEAIAAYRHAIALDPTNPDPHCNLGVLFEKLLRLDEAEDACRHALAIRPDFAAAWNNLGSTLRKMSRWDDAADAFLRALQIDPALSAAVFNLCALRIDQQRLADAEDLSLRMLQLAPDDAEAHLKRAHLLLLSGRLPEGFLEYEWRFRHVAALRRKFPQPAWTGQPLPGNTLLLWTEQGFGDALQFIRYAPLLAAPPHSARVIVTCPPELAELFQSVAGVTQVIPDSAPLPPFDFHQSLLSLPLIFQTTLDTIPAAVPYLTPPPAKLSAWQQRLPKSPSELHIGLVWAGRPENTNDRNRSCTLADFAPLAAVPHARFFSLQKGPAANQAAAPPPGMNLTDLGPHLADFSDTAAALTQLDLVISVDTAVLHLAGALARPVWAILPHVPEWRWLLHRPDSPWYPTLHLHRQPHPTNWSTPLTQIASALPVPPASCRPP